MRLPQSPEVQVVGPGEPLKTLMDKNIMNQKVGNTIECDSDADKEHKAVTLDKTPNCKEQHGNCGKHYKKVVVLFKEMGCFIMMIFM